MALFLLELEPPDPQADAAVSLLDDVAEAASASAARLLEATVAADGARAFAVLEAPDAGIAGRVGRAVEGVVAGPDPVRLVGADIEEVRAARGEARYLVEWDFPEGLSMDAYLERKQANSPRYADVPEVSFLRTYVREDMGKCLCLYDAGSEADVRRARDVVRAPVTRLHELSGAATPERA